MLEWQILNLFWLTFVLFRGAFATVHLCQGRKDGKQYAVKITPKNQTPTQRDAMETEVKIMWNVSGHPHIVKLVDLYEGETQFYMVLELYLFLLHFFFFVVSIRLLLSSE